MDETHVVTAFLRNDADVLLLRRSDEVGSYAGKWGTVAGHADGDPDRAAREEVREEAGVDPSRIDLVRRGESFAVEDPGLGTRWVVHPYLFDCPARAVDPNWETSEVEWAPPTELLRRETVPDLWRSYDAVAPTVESVRADDEHGSAYLSVRALEVLRDRAAVAVEEARRRDDRDDASAWADLATLAVDLRESRPGMAALGNRVNRAMADAVGERTASAVEIAAANGIDRALRADERAAASAGSLVDGRRVFTLSRSGTVRATVEDGDPAAVLVVESRPGGEGVAVAEDLADGGLDVTLATDAAVAWLVGDADVVLVGADAVLPDGGVVNKVGTRPAALAAARDGVPVYAVCAADKVLPAGEDALELPEGDPAAVYDGPTEIDVRNPVLEATEADLVTGVVTEDGVLDDEGVEARATEHRELAGWAD